MLPSVEEFFGLLWKQSYYKILESSQTDFVQNTS